MPEVQTIVDAHYLPAAEQQQDPIERLRAKYSEFMSIAQYCEATDRSPASAYNDLKRIAGLGIKLYGPKGPTRIVRDKWLEELAKSPAWVPLSERESGPA